jgi:hypothetical protein
MLGLSLVEWIDGRRDEHVERRIDDEQRWARRRVVERGDQRVL